MKIVPFKIEVNPEESEKVQRILFKNGYCWKDGDTIISELNSPLLYFRRYSGRILKLTCSDSSDYLSFDGSELPELTFDTFMTLYGKYDIKLGR